ncbi:MAG: nitrogen fixation protein [Bacteroidetes bacterium]|nr:MAG: nitrogen fixation protein [Bacteroidota bacterium]
MKIAVCSQNRKEVTGHAGRCRKFWVYNIGNNQISEKELIELPKEQSLRELAQSPVNDPTFIHPAYAADVLITGGMGMGLFNRLGLAGTKGIVTTEKDPDSAVNLFLNGKLPMEEPHRHGHGHDHHK